MVLGIVEGLTEFLPVSSTGHLTITERLLGLDVDDPAVTGFTAVIQMGAIAAVIVYFRSDFARLISAWFRGLRDRAQRGPDYRFAWYVGLGSLPIGVVGLAARDLIEGPLRSLVVVGVALIAWSGVMVYAERRATQERGEASLTLRDALLIGAAQCIALVPGVSRSGATISVALLLGLDRVAGTRLSFFLAVPALTAAGILQLPEALGDGTDVGVGPTVIGTVVSFVVAYAAIAWLLRFVANHAITAFVPYRLALGAAVLVLVGVNVL